MKVQANRRRLTRERLSPSLLVDAGAVAILGEEPILIRRLPI
ncbi:hypothetical protein ONR57_22415 [Hoyosella sp. YIM 151337]|nr:hypothetical protein [Hoyosella sp. YIM 151337]MCW4356067.1 hypothetical protein [Hoyosella sp. YIM 151337]